MKKFFSTSLILLLSIAVWGCKDNSSGPDSDITEASQVKQFVWNAMNYWYYWQADVPELADDMAFFDDEQDYHDYLMGFADAEAVFEDLLFNDENFGNMGEDDFSFFIEDHEEFRQAQQGVSRDFGFEYGLVRFCQGCSEIFGYVQYVLENSPADEADLVRGDIFTAINGINLTTNNYRSALANDTYELTLADYNGGNITENGESVTVQSTQLTEDPIHISKIIEAGSTKVGYMLYNSFQLNSHQNLNDKFGDFLSAGIDELVLDLRYNGGGQVLTADILASLIAGISTGNDFLRITFNQKRLSENILFPFLDGVPLYDENRQQTGEITMNTLSLDRVYILTGFGTASASEAVINGLLPFIDVTIIGRQTVGKDDVSFTLYDTPAPDYTEVEDANPEHKIALQPIVAKSVNANGESNNDGFLPQGDLFIDELHFLDDLPPLGDESDPLLAKALELITGEPVAKALATPIPFAGEMFKDSRELDRYNNNGLYLLPEQIKRIHVTPEEIQN